MLPDRAADGVAVTPGDRVSRIKRAMIAHSDHHRALRGPRRPPQATPPARRSAIPRVRPTRSDATPSIGLANHANRAGPDATPAGFARRHIQGPAGRRLDATPRHGHNK